MNKFLKNHSIFLTYWKNIQKPKYKFLVAMNVKKDLYFVINSKIHPYVKNRHHLLKSQVKISKSDYTFLKQDSYIACHEIVYGKEINNLSKKNNIPNGIKFIDKLLPQTKTDILKAIFYANEISSKDKVDIISGIKKTINKPRLK